MINQTITLSSDGSLSPASVSLGTADDHLVRMLEFTIPEEFTSLGCYARLCFDGKFTAPLIPTEGKISYIIPKSVVESTPVFAELKCYKVTNGAVTAKLTSEMLTIYCSPTLSGTTDFPDELSEPYENAVLELGNLINRADDIIGEVSSEYNTVLESIENIRSDTEALKSSFGSIEKDYINNNFIALYCGNSQWTQGMISGLREGYFLNIPNITLKKNIEYTLEVYCTPVLNEQYSNNPIFYVVIDGIPYTSDNITIYDGKLVGKFTPTKDLSEIGVGICTEDCKLSGITQFGMTHILYSDTLLGSYSDRIKATETALDDFDSRLTEAEYHVTMASNNVYNVETLLSEKVSQSAFNNLVNDLSNKQNLESEILIDTTPAWQRMIGHPLDLPGYYSGQNYNLVFYSGIKYTVRIVCDRWTPIMYYGDSPSVWFTNASYNNLIKFKVDMAYENGAYVGEFTPNTDYNIKEMVMTELTNDSISARDIHIGKVTVTAHPPYKRKAVNCGNGATVLLGNNLVFKFPSVSQILRFTLELPDGADDTFYSEIRFCTGTSGAEISGALDMIYLTGDNCSNGVFTPALNTRYQIKVWYSNSWQGEVRGVPDGTGGNS